MEKPGLVIFDFDGTIANTGPLICACFSAAVAETAARRPPAAFRAWLGHPLERVHEMLRDERSDYDQGVDGFIELYKRRYRALSKGMTRTFPGVLETLEALDALDVPMAIASTKPTSVLLEQTQELGIRGLFGHIQGTDGFAHKPDPEILYRVWAVVPMPPARTVFVGDSAMDIEAGLAAGVTAIGVTTGAQDRRALIEAGAHAVIDSLGELLGLMA